MILHHYTTAADASELGFTDAGDPGFAPYAEFGSSNIYLVDLLTGASRRITNVGPGEYALFPHFRSDGWIYFVVRTLDGAEYFAASDAALFAENL
jgi:Tol biopolymer transport system component